MRLYLIVRLTQLFAAEEEPLLLGRQVGQLGDLLLHLSDRGHLGYLRDGLDLPAITYAYENHPAAQGEGSLSKKKYP